VAELVNLLFTRAPLSGNPVDLIFGENEAGGPAEVEVSIVGAMPGLTGVIDVSVQAGVAILGALPGLVGSIEVDVIALSTDVVIVGVMPSLTAQVSAEYVSGAARPLVNESAADWQSAKPLRVGAEQTTEMALRHQVGRQSFWQRGVHRSNGSNIGFQNASRGVAGRFRARHQDAQRLGTETVSFLYQNAIHTVQPILSSRFQKGVHAGQKVESQFQDAIRDRRNWAAGVWQKADPHSVRQVETSGPADWLNVGRNSAFQQAMKPDPGLSIVPVPPVDPGHICYTPPLGDAVHLAFVDSATDSTDLVFVCEPQGPGTDPVAVVVVPVKRVYVVINESTLRRVDGDILLPTFSMNMSLDVDSWTWTFSASLPGAALADLQPAAPGEPILVEATINGVPYRMQVERRGRDRTFSSNGLKISGRGLAAVLDAPHAPVMNFTNTGMVSAQQLMNDVLKLNGVSIGWDIDWSAVDWAIPAGLFSHQGAYISAINAIASAAGSYVQPHPVDQVLRILPRYPELPWNWAGVTPDYEIPSDVATVENIEWIEKALYNRVFVSGVQEGVLGQVTRAGTDGGLVAPMVTDALITTAAAARQRGAQVLADTGSQANVSLRMPVLAETGIIVPGKFVRYVDGGEVRIGLARSVAVEVNTPETWQTIVLETHV